MKFEEGTKQQKYQLQILDPEWDLGLCMFNSEIAIIADTKVVWLN